MKEVLKKEHTRRLKMILKCKWNAKNKITRFGALAIPVLKYSFGKIYVYYLYVTKSTKNRHEN
jgi:hypothetical protein